jgi:mitochondrial fission protein ELM1
MPPSFKKHYLNKIDAIFYHSYKFNKLLQNNLKFIGIDMAPHNLHMNDVVLREDFARLKSPIYTILIGGDAKSIQFSKKSVDSLLSLLLKINKQDNNQSSFLISTSARTSPKIALYLKNILEKSFLSYQLFLYKKDAKNNPYKEMLVCCDNIIVSGESVSMISECASLEGKKLYIFFNKSFYAKRYTAFHKKLYQNHYANPLEDIFKTILPQHKINITQEVAIKIKKIAQ